VHVTLAVAVTAAIVVTDLLVVTSDVELGKRNVGQNTRERKRAGENDSLVAAMMMTMRMMMMAFWRKMKVIITTSTKRPMIKITGILVCKISLPSKQQ